MFIYPLHDSSCFYKFMHAVLSFRNILKHLNEMVKILDRDVQNYCYSF